MDDAGDDRLLPVTRWTAWLVTPVLLVAGLILFLVPGETSRLWAWTIGSEMTALAVGAGYLAGAWFFLAAARTDRWHRMAIGVVGASALSTLLLITTILHWDLFTHDHVSFWAWLVLYVVTPVLLPALVVLNRSADPGGTVPTPVVPGPVRLALGGLGIVQLGVAGVMMVRPTAVFGVWPWPLTPLTARTLAAFLVFIAVLEIAFLLDERWSALELPARSATLGLVLVGIGAVRARGELAEASPGSVAAFIVLLIGIVAALVAVQVVMDRRVRTTRSAAAAG